MVWLTGMFSVSLMGTPVPAALAAQNVARFATESTQPPAPWQSVRFDDAIPATRYQIKRWDNVLGIEAKAHASMSLLGRPVQIDLQQTPIMCWQWRIDAPLKSANMRKKSGDDYAARVYVAFKLPNSALSFTTKIKLLLARKLYGEQVPDAAINYVWDNRYPVGTQMPNAYTAQTRMIVQESGPEQAGHWLHERRNLLQDAEQVFGKVAFQVTLLAVATDTDNTGESAHAGFADLHFVAEQASCQF